MKIPNSFQLMGKTIEVILVDDLLFQDDCKGRCDYAQDLIELQKPSAQTPYKQQDLELTFLHELVHLILRTMAEDSFDPPLHKRECLVDRIAQGLHQALRDICT